MGCLRLPSVLGLVLLFTLFFSFLHPVLAGEAGQLDKQFVQKLEIRPVSPEAAAARAAEVGSKVWMLAQAYSLPLVVVSFALGAFLIVLGALVSRRVMGAGFTLIFLGLLAFMLINYAPEIVGLTRSLVEGAFRGK